MPRIELDVDEDQLTEALIDCCMLVTEREDKKLREMNQHATKQAISELMNLFVKNHKSFNDKNFLLIKRFLLKVDRYDLDIEDEKSEKEFDERCRKVSYKTMEDFNESGNLI